MIADTRKRLAALLAALSRALDPAQQPLHITVRIDPPYIDARQVTEAVMHYTLKRAARTPLTPLEGK